MVEKRWRAACKTENEKSADSLKDAVLPLLPTDSELAVAFVDRKKREGSARGFGIRVAQSAEGSDSWVDDPITRHIISLYINKEEEGENHPSQGMGHYGGTCHRGCSYRGCSRT